MQQNKSFRASRHNRSYETRGSQSRSAENSSAMGRGATSIDKHFEGL